jgi:hypothetical protein
MIPPTRRTALRSGVTGFTLFAFAGAETLLTPRQAKSADLPYITLTPSEVATLEALGNRLVPGAAEDGIAHFIDQQISVPPADALLTLRYLDFPPPFAAFYEAGLSALNAASQAIYNLPFAQLTAAQQDSLIVLVATGTPTGWTGIPAPLFYYALRSDAVDVVYGTREGFDRLNIPYMPHIDPPRSW